MELKQMEFFIACADCGSCGRAAGLLFTSQANVSKNIRQLEEELGKILFVRRSTGMYLTEEGKEIYHEVKEILNRVKHLSAKNTVYADTLYVASNPSNFIAHEFVKFIKEKTEIAKYSFMESSTDGILKLVESEKAEIGLLYIEENKKNALPYFLDKRQLEFHKIASAQLVLTVGPNHPLFGKSELTLEDLQKQQYISIYDDADSKTYHLQQAIQELGLRDNMPLAINTNSDYVSRYLLEETDKVQIAYSIGFKRSDELPFWLMPIDTEKYQMQLGYIVKRNRLMSDFSQEFLNKIQTEFQKNAYCE